jgi:hypothetical protein
LAFSSARVSPWVKQPGRAGTSAQKPPSSASWTITLTLIPGFLLADEGRAVALRFLAVIGIPQFKWRKLTRQSFYLMNCSIASFAAFIGCNYNQ